MGNVLDTLQMRGFVYQTTDVATLRQNLGKRMTLYAGFDPSADSLHLGHLLPIMAMHHFQEAGHEVIFLVGGATGLVGDPTGKASSRKMLTQEDVKRNADCLRKQVERMGLLRFSGRNRAIMVNNADWIGKMKLLDYLLSVVPHFSVNEMVGMKTFEDRLGNGIALSLLEFLYPTLQSLDFLHLAKTKKCYLQIGGQDQWGNITQGIELIRKALRKEAFALTVPLLTTPDGTKMGKTEKGPLWLDPAKTTPFEFYQYLVKTPDSMVPTLFKLYTLLPLHEISSITAGDPKVAQERLAYEVTRIVHGEEEADKARNADSMPTYLLRATTSLEQILVNSGCLPSLSEARRRAQGGALYIDGKKVSDARTPVASPCNIQYGKGKLLKVVAS